MSPGHGAIQFCHRHARVKKKNRSKIQLDCGCIKSRAQDTSVRHAGGARIGFQACAAHVRQWVRECDLIKDSFGPARRSDTPTLINRDQRGTWNMCGLPWRRRRRVSSVVLAITATKGEKKRSLLVDNQQWYCPQKQKHSLYYEGCVLRTDGISLGRPGRWVSLLHPMVSRKKSHFPPYWPSPVRNHIPVQTPMKFPPRWNV